MSTAELQDPGSSSHERLLDALPPQTDPPAHTDPQSELEDPTSDLEPGPGPGLSPSAAAEACCPPAAPFPTGRPKQTDCSAQGKKKKSIFSKGKKLLRKLGSSKKD